MLYNTLYIIFYIYKALKGRRFSSADVVRAAASIFYDYFLLMVFKCHSAGKKKEDDAGKR